MRLRPKIKLSFRDLRLRTKIICAALVPIIFFAILSGVAVHNVRQLLGSIYAVDYSHRVVRQALRIQEDALNMQTGMRGFLLTGQDDFLEPYRDGEKAIRSDIAELRTSVEADPAQVRRLDEIEKIIDSWKRNSAEPAIKLRQEIGDAKGMDDLAELVAEGVGKRYMDRLREQSSAFIARERVTLKHREDEMRTKTNPAALLETAERVRHSHQVLAQAESLQAAAADMESAVRGYLLAGKEEFLQPYKDGVNRVFSTAGLQRTLVSDNPEQLKLVEAMEQILREWIDKVAEPQIALRRQISASKTMADLRALVARSEDQLDFDRFRETMAVFKAQEEGTMTKRQAAADSTALTTQRVLAVGTVALLLAAILVSFPLSGAITRPIAAAVDLAVAISRGDLSKSLPVKGTDEVGRLASALNEMLENLREQTRRTLEGVNVLWASAAEISSTVAQLGQTTSKMSAAVAETSTTVEQVKQSARVASERARKVATDSQQAVEVSVAGTKATEDTTTKMNHIKKQMESIGETVVKLSQQSQAIEAIIETVQDLADQSNLLAVNASIEAARAGEQGRGFAVVAHEIKSLAEQSKSATAQIRSILEETRKWVSAVVMATEEGSKAVEAGVLQSAIEGESIHALASSLTASFQSAQVIDTSTEQQFVGVDQVAQAMANIDQAMQQNVSGMSQLEGAARRLEELGESLKELVERYRV
ncbi:MAG: methyl-accepting chemotaxis protein [Desulfomonile sp.]|nr:methyl-accepting chemotaxis protein [Desulfomonile sp.]